MHDTLHTASLAARPLRRGLDETSAREAAPHLRVLTGAQSLAILGPDGGLLAWTGPHEALSAQVTAVAGRAIDDGRRVLVATVISSAAPGDHDVRALVAQPLLIEGTGVVGALAVVTTTEPGPAMLGALTEVARYACGQLELAELDSSRARLDRAEVRALRAQISPHFIYTRSARSRRSCAPTRNGRGNWSSSSPTSPATRSGRPASTPCWRTSCATSTAI